jgi:quinol monooxygenase YgiN
MSGVRGLLPIDWVQPESVHLAAKEHTLVTVGLLVTLEAKPGKEGELVAFLEGALPLVEDEPETTAWFAVRLASSRFAIFDAFPSEAGREAHLTGPVAAALMENAPELLASEPVIETVDVLADKLPN